MFGIVWAILNKVIMQPLTEILNSLILLPFYHGISVEKNAIILSETGKWYFKC